MNKIALDRTGSLEGFERILEEVLSQKAEGVLIFSCEGNGFAAESMQPLLRKITVPVFGGIFPSIIYGSENLKMGTIVAGFSKKPRVQIITDLRVDRYIFNDNLVTDQTQTMFVLVDGLVMKVSHLLDSLFDSYGSELKYLGGGAGSITTMEPSPCLFTNDGLIQNGAILMAIDNQSNIGASHGLKSVSGPHVITKADGNTVLTIDHKPIYPFFQETIMRLLKPGQDDSFPLVSRYFSLGLNCLGEEKVIREPAKVIDNKSMVFGTEMLEGELLDIMKADYDEILAALIQTRNRVKPAEESSGTLVIFDCICRSWFFGERYSELLNALHDTEFPLIGAQTIGGEIACNGDGYLEYLNRTCVLGYVES